MCRPCLVVIEALLGAFGQIGIDVRLRGDPCARARVGEVAIGIAENFGDASIQVWNLDQDQPGSLPAPCSLVKQPLCGGSMPRDLLGCRRSYIEMAVASRSASSRTSVRSIVAKSPGLNASNVSRPITLSGVATGPARKVR